MSLGQGCRWLKEERRGGKGASSQAPGLLQADRIKKMQKVEKEKEEIEEGGKERESNEIPKKEDGSK